MISIRPRNLLLLLSACLSFSFQVSAQSPDIGFTAPTEHSFEVLRDTQGAWWHSYRIQTVPGVVYRIQKSENLIDWEDASSVYGNDQEAICPLFPGHEPAFNDPTAPTLPAGGHSAPFVPLVLERGTDGTPLLSWKSLDDATAKRVPLSGVTLDPAWEDFESYYLNAHGDYLFAISSRIGAEVHVSETPPSLGTLDSAMVGAFTAALPAITANIQQSLSAAANHTPPPIVSGDRAFYRIVADWNVDSDGDGRTDWQEILFDGNNPFASDSDGDGIADQALAASPGGSSLPTPGAVAPPTPKISFQQRYIGVALFKGMSGGDEELYLSLFGCSNGVQEQPHWHEAVQKNSYPELVAAIKELSFGDAEAGWDGDLKAMDSKHMVPHPQMLHAEAFRQQYRVKLDSPAPEGGYRIKLKVINIAYLETPGAPGSPSNVAYYPSAAPFQELEFEVPEGDLVSAPVDVNCPALSSDKLGVTCAAHLTVIKSNGEALPADGGCFQLLDAIRLNIGTNVIPDEWVRWQRRQLLADGSFTGWETMHKNPAGEPLEGTFPSPYFFQHYGIFQIRAKVTLPGNEVVHIPYIRMRHARAIRNSRDDDNPHLKAGEWDYVGVARNAACKALRDSAVNWLGSVTYAKDDNHVVTDPYSLYNPNTNNKSKCNLFVAHVAVQAGFPVPFYFRKLIVPTAPLAREDWYTDPEDHVDLDAYGWKYWGTNSRPHPGMVISSPGAGADAASGHVGFVDYDGSWINAGKLTVNKSIHITDPSQDYKPNSMRSINSGE